MKTSKKVIVFILINAIVLALLTFLLNAPSCTKLLMGDAETGDYDTLIMGQSHAYAGYNPFIISEILQGRLHLPIMNIICCRRSTKLRNIKH